MGQGPGICRFCHKPVLWVITDENHKSMPVDPVPHVDGNVAVYHNENMIPMCFVITPVKPIGFKPGAQPHKSHFETCTNLPRRTKPIQMGTAAEDQPDEPTQDELNIFGANVVPFRRGRR